MSDSKDITTRVHDAFLKEISSNPCLNELETPLRSLMASEAALKPDDLVKIYERTNKQLPESNSSQ